MHWTKDWKWARFDHAASKSCYHFHTKTRVHRDNTPETMKIILLPGMDGTGDLFADFAQALGVAADVQIVGYPRNQALGYAELESLVRAQLPRTEDFVLLAESFSGPIAMAIAAQAPSNLRGLVLCCTFARPPSMLLAISMPIMHWFGVPKWTLPMLAPWLLGPQYKRDQLENLKRVLESVSQSVLYCRLKAVHSVNAVAQLREVKAPTILLWADHDHVLGPSVLCELSQTLPAMCIRRLEGPHLLLQTRASECAQQVRSFLDYLGTGEKPADCGQA